MAGKGIILEVLRVHLAQVFSMSEKEVLLGVEKNVIIRFMVHITGQVEGD